MKRSRLCLILGLLCFNFSLFSQKNMVFKFKGEIIGGLEFKENSKLIGTELALELPLYGDHKWEFVYNL